MHPRHLTPVEIADLLDRFYREDQAGREHPTGAEERTELADFLGCHEEVRAQALEAWREMLAGDRSVNLDDAEFWLDVVFIEPCPSSGEGPQLRL